MLANSGLFKHCADIGELYHTFERGFVKLTKSNIHFVFTSVLVSTNIWLKYLALKQLYAPLCSPLASNFMSLLFGDWKVVCCEFVSAFSLINNINEFSDTEPKW